MTRVLVTGAGGFIGSHLASDLASREHEVVALDLQLERVRHLEAPGRFELFEDDVADPRIQRRALEAVDTVYHLAAAHLGASVRESEFWRINVEGLERLVSAAAAAGVRRFVHCSSVGVYGRIQRPPADEFSPCKPELIYEKTKLRGEEVVLEAVRRHSFPAVVLRPVWVYGPGCPRTERLFRAIEKRRFVVAGRGDQFRHCVYVRDLVAAFRLAARSEAALGQVIVVGDAAAVTVRQLVDEIARLVRVPRPRSVPVPLLYFAALLAELVYRPAAREPPLSRRTLRFFTANTSFDIRRARSLLGYGPRYDLKQGLAETHRLLTQGRPWRVSAGNGSRQQTARRD